MSAKQYLLSSARVISILALLSVGNSFNPTPASAAEFRWSRVNTPVQGKPGNWVLAKSSDVQLTTLAADGTLYAYGKGLTYTLYRSADGGLTWAETGNVTDTIVAIATPADNASMVYYATAASVYRSNDGGKSFDRLPAGPGGAGSNNIEITAMAVRRNESNMVAVATRDTDAGQFGGVYLLDEALVIPAWTNTGLAGYDVYAVAFSPQYASDRQLVAIVTDETDTYVTARVGNGAWGAAGNARLNRDNSGAAVAVNTSAAIAFPGDYDAASGGSTLFVAVNTGSHQGDVYKTNIVGGGSSIATDLNIGAAYGSSNTDVTGLAVTGSGGTTHIFAGAAASAQVYSSADGGASWTKSRKEPTGTAKTYILMVPGDNGKAYAATSGAESAFSVSLDGGATWDQTGLIDTEITLMVDFAPSPDYLVNKTLFLLTYGGEHSLWRSLNGGNSWQRVFTSSLPGIDVINYVSLPPQHGKNSQVVFLAGTSNGNPALWKSTNNGQTFTVRPAIDPTTGGPIPVNSWAIVNESTLFIGSYNGTNGLIYATTNSGLSYSSAARAGSLPINSIVLSPDYEQSRAVLLGNSAGSVYLSKDSGTTFTALPSHTTSPPLAGALTVAFDPRFSSNSAVYAASNTAGKGIFRFVTGTSTEWTSIDSSLPAASIIHRILVLPGGALYAVNSKIGAGMERSLNPTFSLGPAFESISSGVSANSILAGLWWSEPWLWTVDSVNLNLLVFADSLTAPVTLSSPADKSAGMGTLSNNTVNNITLDWKALAGATSYQWQLNYGSDFTTVPAGFEGSTSTSSVRLPALEPGTTYYWRVRASAPAATPWSEKWSFSTSLNTATAGLKLASPEAGATGIPTKPVFQWEAINGAAAYELIVAKDVNFSDTVIVKAGEYALPATAWESNVSLSHGTTYYWKVRGTSATSQSHWSAVSAFTTEPAPSPSPAPTPTPLLSPTPQLASAPSIQTVNLMPTATPRPIQEPAPAPYPPLPPSPPQPVQVLPGWAVYLVGALLFIIVMLLVIILTMVLVFRRD